MIPAGILNQSSLIGNPVWYLDFRPTNAAKPLTGSMGPEWHTVNVPFNIYETTVGDYGFVQTNVPISVSMENLSPINGDEKISAFVLSQDVGGGVYGMAGYMFDPNTGTTFNRSRERSLALASQADIIGITFSNAGTYKMYINSTFPSGLGPTEMFSYFGTILQSESGIENEGEVLFDTVARTLTSSALEDPGWHTNDVEGDCIFTVEAGWALILHYMESSGIGVPIIGQIAIEKIG